MEKTGIEVNYKKIIEQLTLMDDLLMNQVFNDHRVCKELLKPILNVRDLEIIESTTQKLVENSRGLNTRFDVLAKDKDGNLYDIEMQQDDRYAVPERGRYYSSMLDHKSLNKKKIKNKRLPWRSLPETYVIFFTAGDHYHAGLPMYHINRHVEETGFSQYGDRQHIIYVNCSYQDLSSDIGLLIHDLNQSDPKTMFNKILADRVQYIKEITEGDKTMSEVMQNFYNQAFEDGIIKGKIEGELEGRMYLLRNIYNYCRNQSPSADPDDLLEQTAVISSTSVEEVREAVEGQPI